MKSRVLDKFVFKELLKCREQFIVNKIPFSITSSLHQPDDPSHHPVHQLAPCQTLHPLRGDTLHAIKRSRHAAVDRAHRVGIVAQINRLQRPLTKVVRGEKGPQGGLERVDDVAGAADVVRVDGGEGGPVRVLGELETEFGVGEGVGCERKGEVVFRWRGGGRGEDEGEEMGVDLAGFGVGGVGVGEDGGSNGVAEREGGVGMIDQCDGRDAHERAVPALYLS